MPRPRICVHDSIADAELLIVLGGPIGAYETAAYPFLTSELALIEHRLSRDLPMLGICLGSQLMAKALGSRVFAGPVKEIGWGGVELTGEGAASCLAPLRQDDAVVLHWHGDSFDLPRRRAAAGIERGITRTRHSPIGATRWRCSFTSRPTRTGWSNGMSAMPPNSPRQNCQSPNCGRPPHGIADGRARLADRVFTRWLREIGTDIKVHRHCEERKRRSNPIRCHSGSARQREPGNMPSMPWSTKLCIAAECTRPAD